MKTAELANKKQGRGEIEPGPIGRRVRELRESVGINQTQLADAVGVHRVTIARIETNAKFNPSLELLQKLAGALGCRVVDLVADVPPLPSSD